MQEKIPILAIVGPTATGKSALGIALAKRYHGEIVSADAMQIYAGLDIATAKPTPEEMQDIPHHLIGVVPLEQAFSLAEYLDRARPVIADIHTRGKLPIVVGGTGLYISSLLSNTQLVEMKSDPDLRQSLLDFAQAEGNHALYQKLKDLDPEAAAEIHPNNVKRVARAIEVCTLSGKTWTQCQKESQRQPTPYHAVQIGLTFSDREVLYHRIDQRVENMVKKGLQEEAYDVWKRNLSVTATDAIGYKEWIPYFEGTATRDACIARIQQETRHYAKRQLTWFRRDKSIFWVALDTIENETELLEMCETIIHENL